jgi:carbon starvation protein
VVFAHHFASIAGAGPIVGPVLALYFGWLPAVIWIILGGVFIGAVHDYVTTYMAVREGGRNIAVVGRRLMGRGAFILLTFLLVAALVLVCACFLNLSAAALTSVVPLEMLGMEAGQSLFSTIEGKHPVTGKPTQLAQIGGIASMSVIVITACSPLLGVLYFRRRWPVWRCSALAIGICAASLAIGMKVPVRVGQLEWKLLIAAYVLVASGLPVWVLLQSRDFINVHILYVGMALLIVSLIGAVLSGAGNITSTDGAIPASNIAQAQTRLGPVWPMLFITIACGAVSGFHALCAGGTTCKQLTSERAARSVGYNGMLLESFLAVLVVCVLAVGLSFAGYQGLLYPTAAGAKGNAVLTFAMGVGHTAHRGLGLSVAIGAIGAMLLLEGFLVTTLDTAVRLTRYLLEEGWATLFDRYDVYAVAAGTDVPGTPTAEGTQPVGAGGLVVPADQSRSVGGGGVTTRGVLRGILRLSRHYWFNSACAVGLMLALGLGNGYKALWGIFAASNQLLASLGLLIATLWILRQGRSVWFTLLPCLAMITTALYTLVWVLVKKYIPGWPDTASLLIADVVVLALAVGVLGFAIRTVITRQWSVSRSWSAPETSSATSRS